MSRFIFAAASWLLVAGTAAAQAVPGRDLLDFPLGLLAEAPPLSRQMIGGLWNPATAALDGKSRGAIGFAGLTTPQDQGVNLEMLSGSYVVRPRVTASLSFAQASVNDILKTETDPQSLGGEIPYATTITSAGLSAVHGSSKFGLAARFRSGTVDADHARSLSLDAGAIVDRVAGTPVRLAASTFLFSPARHSEEATYFLAADLPLVRRDSMLVVRGGYSIAHTEGRGREEYGFATATYRQFDASAGVSQAIVFGNRNQRWRLGLGLHYAGYTVAIGREDGAAGFPPSYQFLLTRVLP
jgi:hypothetical protein